MHANTIASKSIQNKEIPWRQNTELTKAADGNPSQMRYLLSILSLWGGDRRQTTINSSSILIIMLIDDLFVSTFPTCLEEPVWSSELKQHRIIMIRNL